MSGGGLFFAPRGHGFELLSQGMITIDGSHIRKVRLARRKWKWCASRLTAPRHNLRGYPWAK